MRFVCEARAGFAGGIDEDQPEPDRVGSGNDLDALDHESAAIPKHSHLAGSRGPAAGVDQQPVSVVDGGLPRMHRRLGMEPTRKRPDCRLRRLPRSPSIRNGRLSLWVFGLAMAGNLLTAMVALEAVGSGGSPEGPERSEGATKRLAAPLPTAHPVSHMY